MSKPLHGIYPNEVSLDHVDIQESNCWLTEVPISGYRGLHGGNQRPSDQHKELFERYCRQRYIR